jgi:hypothetical protein
MTPTREICPECGWQLATADGYCQDCEPPDDDDWGEEWACTHCGGDGDCMDGADPLGNCPDEPHRCHACGGSGRRKDQTLF